MNVATGYELSGNPYEGLWWCVCGLLLGAAECNNRGEVKRETALRPIASSSNGDYKPSSSDYEEIPSPIGPMYVYQGFVSIYSYKNELTYRNLWSASEATALRRYTNQIIIIIINRTVDKT